MTLGYLCYNKLTWAYVCETHWLTSWTPWELQRQFWRTGSLRICPDLPCPIPCNLFGTKLRCDVTQREIPSTAIPSMHHILWQLTAAWEYKMYLLSKHMLWFDTIRFLHCSRIWTQINLQYNYLLYTLSVNYCKNKAVTRGSHMFKREQSHQFHKLPPKII